jgi:hypothetical protein
MRFRSSLVAAALLAMTSSVAQAQAGNGGAAAASQCTGAGIATRDACQQTVDMFTYVAPLLGTAIAGGNTTMGQGGSLGTRLGLIPHVTVGVRLNAVLAGFPELQTPSLTGITNRNNSPVSTGVVPMPSIDAGIGVFKGIPLALSNVGGIDILLSASYVPKKDVGDISIDPETPLNIGYGFRIGLLQESLVVPGLGFSYIQRGLPKTTLTATTTGSTFTVEDLDLDTKSWRITASKSLLLFGVALGYGQDTYKSSTAIRASVNAGANSVGPFTVTSDVKRNNMFADVSMNLPFIKLVVTGGQVSGGDIKTYNGYEKDADVSRIYASGGIRFTF